MRHRRSILVVCLLFVPGLVFASPQEATLRVEVRSGGAPVAGVTVTANDAERTTDDKGLASWTLKPGSILVVAAKEGYGPATTTIVLAAGQTQQVVIELARLAHEDRVTVSATRTDKRVEDQPMRVEVLNREEIEEKMLMTPGDIVMMLNEMGGMRVQATSPSLGASSLRMQGMRGRYTRFFSDGLPLFGDVGGLGLLQIPPMDLGQVEVIKGVASSLYGAGAMGGIVNLVSRHPGEEAEKELLINRSTRGGTDVVGWYASPARTGWAFTLLGGGHFQQETDVNEDSWSDLAGYTRALVRPRVFWDGGNGRTFFATAGFMAEDRDGGGIADGLPYREALSTRRADAGAVARMLIGGKYLLAARGAFMRQRHDHTFGEIRERDLHETLFAELTIRGTAGKHTIVGGVAYERDGYNAPDVPHHSFTFRVPGVFIQDDVDVASWLSISASGRLDHHNEYGTFFSPRVSALIRAGAWTSRFSYGAGFVGPSPLTEETEAAGLSRLVVPAALVAERGRNLSFDIGRSHGPFSYTLTVFRSRIRDAVHVDRSAGLVLTNLAEPSTTMGVEFLGTFRREPFAVTATYAFVRARELAAGAVRDVPLTPRHSAGVVAMWEEENTGRVGLEVYYTGAQRLEENPFRETSRPYVIVGLLAERQWGRVRLFINGENLTGVRQTRWDPMIRPLRAPDGRWTVDAWAPLEGRNINGGIRLRF